MTHKFEFRVHWPAEVLQEEAERAQEAAEQIGSFVKQLLKEKTEP